MNAKTSQSKALCRWLVGLSTFFAAFTLRSQPVTESILTGTRITNYTGYLIEADLPSVTNSPAYFREAILVNANVRYTNTTMIQRTRTNYYRFRLLDTNGVPFPIFDVGGNTNLSYTHNVTNLVTVAGLSSVDRSTGAVIRPAARLNPYNRYTVRMEIYTNNTSTGRLTNDGPKIYYHFTNTVSGDAALNVIAQVTNLVFTRSYALQTDPTKNMFQARAEFALRRYDDFHDAANTADNVSVTLSFELRNAATEQVIPLQSSSVTFTRSMNDYIAGNPRRPFETNGTRTLSLEPMPGVQLDSPGTTYKVVATISHIDNPNTQASIIGNTATSAAQRLLHFNGTLYFGTMTATPIETMFSSIANVPPDLGLSGSFVRSQLVVNNNSGFVVGKPTHTYGDGLTLLSVVLRGDGDAVVSAGNVTLNAPLPDVDTAAGITFTRQAGIVLGPSGGIGNVTLTLPAGFGYRADTASRVLESDLTFGDVPFNQALAPNINLTYNPGVTFYACEESKAFWIPAVGIVWSVSQGTFSVTPSGSLFYVRAPELSRLEADAGLTVDPPNMVFKRSNEQYLRLADTVNTPPGIIVRRDAGVARLDIDFNLLPNAPGFRTHFPYGVLVKWTGAGRMVITNGLVDPTNSVLNSAAPLNVSYERACPGCPGADTLNSIQVTPSANRLNFTHDGGLMAQGTMSNPTLLRWGYTPASMKYAQTVSNFLAAGFHAPGIFLRIDQTTLAAEDRPGVLLLTGAGPPLDYLERPSTDETDPYVRDGEADYAGLNFRADVGAAKRGISTLAGTTLPAYPLTTRSKYYARRGGISGVHEAEPGTFPTDATLMGYPFHFSNYGLSYLDNRNKDSRTDGEVRVPYPSQITNEFRRLMFACNGALTTADIADPGETALLKYWDATITPQAIRFDRDESEDCRCNPSQGFLVLGVSTSIAHVEEPLHGELGFLPGGNLITADPDGPACRVPGLNSRLPLPSRMTLKGPGEEKYIFTPVCSAYLNNYDDYPLPPGAGFGFVNLAGAMDVPFFRDLQVHMHTSANGANSFAPIDLMGGWPNCGFGTAAENFFTQADNFDLGNRGFPEESDDPGVTVESYRHSSRQKYHVRAQQNWFGVVDFDYPLNWSSSRRSFTSFIPKTNDIFVVAVGSQVKYLSPQHAELAFGAQYNALPQLNVANLAFNAIDDATGVSHAIAGAIGDLYAPITNGLKRADRLLNDRLHDFFNEIFVRRIDDQINALYDDLVAGYPFAPGELHDILDTAFLGVGAGSTAIEKRLRDIAGSTVASGGMLTEIDSSLSDLDTALNKISEVLAEDGPGGTRTLASDVIRALLGELAAQFAGPAADRAVNDLLASADPALDQITFTLRELKTNVTQLRMQFADPTGFGAEIQATINGAAALAEIQTVATGARDDVESYLNDIIANAVASPFAEHTTNEIRRIVRQKIEDPFFGSQLVSDLQESIRHRLYDLDAAVREGIDSAFQQFNDILRDALSQTLAELDNSFSQVLGTKINGFMAAGKINGYAHINGDALRELRLDGHFQLKAPDNLELDAYLRIRELDSQGTDGCSPASGSATEVTLGADNVNLNWISPDLRASVGTKFTFRLPDPAVAGDPFELLGWAGRFEINGPLDFEAFSVEYLGAAIAFGELENYFSAAAEVTFENIRASGGLYFGRACDLTPIQLFDPQVAELLGSPPFTGAYGYFEGWIPVSEVLLGIPATCMFRIDAGVGMGLGYFSEGPMFVGRMFQGVSGEALCCVGIRGDINLIGVKRGDDFMFSGSGRLKGKVGPCPFCVRFNKRVTITYENRKWDVDY